MIGIEDVEAVAAVVNAYRATAKKAGVKPKVFNDMFWTQPESRDTMRSKLLQFWEWRLEDVLCTRKMRRMKSPAASSPCPRPAKNYRFEAVRADRLVGGNTESVGRTRT